LEEVREHIRVEAQSKVIDKYTSIANAEVGFQLLQDIITVADTNALYDNQGLTPNLTAPGADRYRIRLILANKADLTSNDNFIHIATVKNGVIFKAVDDAVTNIFNIPRDLIATRIKENSGDYIVKPFYIHHEPDSADTHLILNISDGIAVVDGYRAAKYVPTKIRIPKPTTTSSLTNEGTGVSYGNYVTVDGANVVQGPNLNTFDKLYMTNAVNFGGTVIGHCRVRHVSEDGASLRFHLFDIKMKSGENFRDVRSIGASASNYFEPTITGTNSILEDASNNTLIYRLPNNRPESITNSSAVVQVYINDTTDISGNLTVSVGGIGTLTNAGDWTFFSNSGQISNSTLSGLTVGAASTTVGGFSAGVNITGYVYAQRSSLTRRVLTPQEKTKRGTLQTDSDGIQYLDIGHPNVYEIVSIKQNDSNGADISQNFQLDGGQRDNYIGNGRLNVVPGYTPTGTIFTRYKHYEYGNGDYVTVNSYVDGGTSYSDIPSYTNSRNVNFQLRDCIDLRSIADSNGDYISAKVNRLPQPDTLITSDIDYYNSRVDLLSIDKDANFAVRGGIEALNSTTSDFGVGLSLYKIAYRPNTINNFDLKIKKFEHRRYTMKDIERVEKRIDNLEEVVTLNMLETDTNTLRVLDSAGNDRIKSGFFAENFVDHFYSYTRMSDGTRNYDFRASIDPSAGFMRPAFIEDNFRLVYDSSNSSNIVKRGDYLMLNYDEELWLDNPFACLSTAINPFEVAQYLGNMVISPSSDEWRDVEVASKKIIDGGTKLDTTNALNWDTWSWNWGGKDLNDLSVKDKTNTNSTTSGSTKTKIVNKVVSEETILEVIGTKVLNVALLPFMRSRIVRIQAKGLRPNANIGLFFDGVLLEDYVREEAFSYYSDNPVDYGNTLNGLTSHKDGSTALTTDDNGAVDISFQVPNNDVIRFRCGTREIKLMDINLYNKDNLAGSIALGTYSAIGYLDTIHQDILSTRLLHIEGTKTTEQIYTNNDGGGGGWDDNGNNGNHLGYNHVSYNDDSYYGDSMNNNEQEGAGDQADHSFDGGTGSNQPVCLTEDMKVMVNNSLVYVTEVNIGDRIGSTVVTDVIKKHMREGYLIINNELKITNDHPLLVNNEWVRADALSIGDNVNGVMISSIEYVQKLTPTVYIETESDSYEVYCDNNSYTVSGKYGQELKKNIKRAA